MADILSFPATLTLLILNIFASLIAFKNERFNEQNILWVGPMKARREWHRLVSSGFLHVNWPHLVLNMYGLYMFGPVIEYYLGGTNFLIIYMASLIGGSLWACIWNRNNPHYRAAGASGALSGIILAFCMIDPFSMLLFLFIIPMWGIVFGIGFVVLSYVFSQRENRVIGHEAHLGGAVTGIVTTLVMAPQVWTHFLMQISEKFG